MTHISDEQLALYAGGDLTREETGAVEEHLRDCAECQALLADLRDSRAVLLECLREPAADELRSVRHRVVQRLQKQAGGRWIWVTAAAAIIVAGLFLNWKQPRRARHSNTVATAYLRVPYRPKVQMSIPNLTANVEPVRARRHHPAPGLRTVALLAERDGPPILKMTTSDPDVVILWQLNERTQRQ